MKQIHVFSVIAVLCLGSSIVRAESDNPFGFATQTHPLEYEYCKPLESKHFSSHFWYECRSAPRMHPDIERIALKFVDEVGLCALVAKSFRTISLDGLKEQITETYGPPTSQEEYNERAIRYDWEREAGFPGLGDIESILAETATGGRVRLIFRLVTNDACNEAIDQKRAEAF